MASPLGTKSIKASLKISPMSEVKKDVKKMIEQNNDLKKLFNKPITYEDKVDLNPKKWNAGKLNKLMEVWVRYEMKILAQRVAEAFKKGKSEKDIQGIIDKALKDAQKMIDEKCATALDDLESGAGEAKAGLSILKKVMAKVNDLNPASVISDPLDLAISSTKKIKNAEKKTGDTQSAQDAAKKELRDALSSLDGNAKELRVAAKYLTDNGKKLKGSDIGPLAAFGKKVDNSKVMAPLIKLMIDINTLKGDLIIYGKDLQEGSVDADSARRYESKFGKHQSSMKSASPAIKVLKDLHVQYKTIEKALK